MLLSDEQLERLKGDLDYILAHTKCDTIQLSKGQVLGALQRDPDVMLELVEAMPPAEARWLSVPPDTLRALIARRARGQKGDPSADVGLLLISV